MYEYNGKQYSIQEIESIAKKAGYNDYLSYIDDYPGFKEVEETIIEDASTETEQLPGVGLDFQSGPAEESAVVGPENVAPEDMDLSSGDISLDSPGDVVVEDPDWKSKINENLSDSSAKDLIKIYKSKYNEDGYKFESTYEQGKGEGIKVTSPNNEVEFIFPSYNEEEKTMQYNLDSFLENTNDPSYSSKIEPVKKDIESRLKFAIERNYWRDLEEAKNFEGDKDSVEDLFYKNPEIVTALKKQIREDYNRSQPQEGGILGGLFGDDKMESAGLSEYHLDELVDNVFEDIILDEKQINYVGGIKDLNESAEEAGINASQQTSIYRNMAIKAMPKDYQEVGLAFADVYTSLALQKNMNGAQEGSNSLALAKTIREKQAYAEELQKEVLGNSAKVWFNYSEGFSQVRTGDKDSKVPDGMDNFDITEAFKSKREELAIVKSEDFTNLETGFNVFMHESTELEKKLENDTYDVYVKNRGNGLGISLAGKGYEVDDKGYFKNVKLRDMVALAPFQSDTYGKFDEVNTNFDREEDKEYLAQGSISDYLDTIGADIRSKAVSKLSYEQVYLMNLNPDSIKRDNFGQATGRSFLNSLGEPGKALAEDLGPSSSMVADEIAAISEDYGVNLTEDQLNNLTEMSAWEEFGGMVGAVPVLALEYGGVNVITGGAAGLLGYGKTALTAMKRGKFFTKSGRRVSYSTITARAKKAGYEGEKGVKAYIAKQGDKINRVGGGLRGEAGALAVNVAKEAANLEIIAGDGVVGAGFAIGSFGMNKLFQRYGLKFKGVYDPLNKFTIDPLKAGISFAAASNVAEPLNAMVDDLLGSKDFETFMDEHYRDIPWFGAGSIARRTLGEVVQGAAFGLTHLKRKDFAITKARKNKLLENINKEIVAEQNKNPQLQSKSKLETLGETRDMVLVDIQQMETAYENSTPELKAARATADMKRSEKVYKKIYGKNLNYRVQMDGKGMDGKPALKTFENGEPLILIDARKYKKGFAPHELFHAMGEKLGITNPEAMSKMRDFLEPLLNKVLPANLKQLIKEKYDAIGQGKETRAEEYIANVIELLGDPKYAQDLVTKNVYGDIKQSVKSFYERRLKGTPMEGEKLNFEGPQQLLDFLYRLSRDMGKPGSEKQISMLKNIAFDGKMLVDMTKGEVVGKTPTSGDRAATDLFQKSDKFAKENKEKFSSKDDKVKLDIAEQLVNAQYNQYTKDIVRRLSQLKLDDKEKEAIAKEFVLDKSRGLVGLVKKFDQEKLVDSEGKPYESISAYLNNKVGGINIRLIDFIKKSPRFDNIINSINREGSKELEGGIETSDQRQIEKALINVRQFVGNNGKPTTESTIRISEALTNLYNTKNITRSDLNAGNIPDLDPVGTAEFFGIPVGKLSSNLTYSSKLIDVNTGKPLTKKELDAGKKGIIQPSEAGNMQNVIKRNITALRKLMAPENVISKDASEKFQGKSVKIPPALLKVLYQQQTKTAEDGKVLNVRSTNKKVQNPVQALKNMTDAQFAEMFGIGLSKGEGNFYNRDVGTRLQALARFTGKLMTNKVVRQIEKDKGATVNELNDMKAGFSESFAAIDVIKSMQTYIKKLGVGESFDPAALQRILFEDTKISEKDRKRIFESLNKINKLSKLSQKGDLKDAKEIVEELAKDEALSDYDIVKRNQSPNKNFKTYLKTKGKKYLTLEELGNETNYKETLELLKDFILDFPPLKDLSIQQLNAVMGSTGLNKALKIYNPKTGKQERMSQGLIIESTGSSTTFKKGERISKTDFEKENKLLTNEGKKRLTGRKRTKIEWAVDTFGKDVLSGRGDIKNYTYINEKGELETADVYQPSSKGAEQSPGWGDPFKNPVIKVVENKSLSDIEMTRELQNLMVPEGKDYTFYPQQVKNNQQFLQKTYENLYEKFQKDPSDKNYYRIQRLLQLQTNHATGIFKGLIPVKSVTKSPEGKPGDSRLHNEHMTELFNASERFLDIMTKFKSTKNSKKGKQAINELVLELTQAITSKTSKDVKDSKEFGGPAGQYSRNNIINTFIKKGSALDQLDLMSPEGNVIAETFVRDIASKELHKLIQEVGEKNRSAVAVEVKQRLDNPKDYAKVQANNLALSKKAGIKVEKNSTTSEIINELKNKDQVNKEKTKEVYASIDLSKQFNEMIEMSTESLGKRIDKEKNYSDIRAKTLGAKKRKYQFFLPDAAQDFQGLLDVTLGKGKQGDIQRAWYKKNLQDTYNTAIDNLTRDRVALQKDFKGLKRQLKVVPKDLRKEAIEGFTYEQAIRVYTWNKQGMKIDGLSKRDLKELTDIVEKNPELVAFSEQLIAINKGSGYPSPTKNWLIETLATDLRKGLNTTKRAEYLEQWQSNVDAIYSKENMNKLQALYGDKYIDALSNSLKRMKLGTNRSPSGSKLENDFMDFINGANGVTMFLNTRSAVLQTTSAINFIEVSGPNNIIAASKAFANQPQFWSDFKKLMNSDYLVDRRNGLKLNVSESEIADAAATATNKFKGGVNYILSKGYMMTRFADSFAIASGGSTYFRNRVNAYMKAGLTKSAAESKAFSDFKTTAEKSQQSADPSKISAQQSTGLGRTILSFANYPMQAARIQKAEALDLINGRGGKGAWKGQVSRIMYYGVIQNFIFNGLQNAIFAAAWEDPEISNADEKKQETRNVRIANGMVDTILRGSGVGGAGVSVLKNVLLKIKEENTKDRADYKKAALEVFSIAPPIDRKLSNLINAANSFEYDLKDMKSMSLTDINNPAYLASANIISAASNIPLERLVMKVQNLQGVFQDQMDTRQRIARFAGWPSWQIGPQKPGKPSYFTPKKGMFDLDLNLDLDLDLDLDLKL